MSMQPRPLLTTVAIVELLTGLGLLVLPATVTRLLLGQPLDSNVALVVGRVAGVALIAIGLMCWLERRSVAPDALLIAVLVYNAAVPVILLFCHWKQGIDGIGLWPAVILHVAIAIWTVVILCAGSAARKSADWATRER